MTELFPQLAAMAWSLVAVFAVIAILPGGEG